MKYHTFKPQFHAAILGGVKRSTIRPLAKVKAGERFALRYWLGAPYRSQMGWLGSVVCTHVRSIRLRSNRGLFVKISGKWLGPEETDRLAQQEGFASAGIMEQWFNENHQLDDDSIDAVLTEWDPSTFIPGEAQP